MIHDIYSLTSISSWSFIRASWDLSFAIAYNTEFTALIILPKVRITYKDKGIVGRAMKLMHQHYVSEGLEEVKG